MRFSTLAALAAVMGVSRDMMGFGAGHGEASQTGGAIALRKSRRGSQRGSPAEQARRIAAAEAKRIRKNARRLALGS